jgi:hypothetical protein
MSSEIFGHGSGAKKNHRKFPGIRGRRPDRKLIRQAEALARDKTYKDLPWEEKLKRNPHLIFDAKKHAPTSPVAS